MSKSDRKDLVELAFEMIAENGWRQLTLYGLAARAGKPLSKIHEEIGSKNALVGQLFDRMDVATFAVEAGELSELTPKERLFELLMRRFDALKPHKPAFVETRRRREWDCSLLCTVMCRSDRLAERLLDSCEANWSGWRRRVAKRSLLAVYAKTFSVWLGDDSQDSSVTMAELDKRLGQLEMLAKFATPRRRPWRKQTDEASAPAN